MKKPYKFKKGDYEAVYVEWLDSISLKPVWHSFSELEKDTQKCRDYMKTVAFIVAENEHEYIFSGSFQLHNEGAVGVGMVFSIPKGAIIKILRMSL